MQIATDLYRRQGKAVTNFQQTLPAHDSDLAQQLLKDPYTFDFLTLTDRADNKAAPEVILPALLHRCRSGRFLLGIGDMNEFTTDQIR